MFKVVNFNFKMYNLKIVTLIIIGRYFVVNSPSVSYYKTRFRADFWECLLQFKDFRFVNAHDSLFLYLLLVLFRVIMALFTCNILARSLYYMAVSMLQTYSYNCCFALKPLAKLSLKPPLKRHLF